MKELEYPFIMIALDIGGTKINGAALYYNQKGVEPSIAYKEKIDSRAKEGAEIFINNICDFALKIKKKMTDDPRFSYIPILGLGMGCAGRIRRDTGEVAGITDNFPGFIHTKLTSVVGLHTGFNAYALNDVQAHTLGEARWGAGKDVPNFIMLGIGTGIGGAVVTDGELMMGWRGFAGELGHIPCTAAHGVPCACGKKGHLEAVASGTGIENTYERRTGKRISGKEISKLAVEGDKHARYALRLAGRALGNAMADFQTVFDPALFIVCGSVCKAGDIWKEAINKGYLEEIADDLKDHLFILEATLGDEAALIGAAEYALDNIKLAD